MKTTSTPVIKLGLPLAGVLALGLAAGCGRDTETQAPPPPAPAARPAEEVLIQTPDGQTAATIRLGSAEVRIELTDGAEKRVLRSRLTKGRRQRIYTQQGSESVALVRRNDKARTFTVRTPDGELRWRVRLRRKITVGDHPEKPAFELRRPAGPAVHTLDQDGNELGRAVFDATGSVVEVLDAQGDVLYRGMGERLSNLYGVLVVPDLDPVERYVIMAELLVRQR